MTNDVKTYQIYNFSVEAKSLEEAVEKVKVILDTNPKKILKEVDKNKWRFDVVNK